MPQNILETSRLLIKPLTHAQLIKYLRNDHSLEKELQLNRTARTISTELKEALEETILPNVADESKNYLFSTLWTVILKAENKMAGDICIVGEPNDKGEIEIGYGTYDEFQRKGFMTEAVGAIIKWAGNQNNVRAILADTQKSNIASYRILLKNNFRKTGETEELYKWRLDFDRV